MSPRRGGERSLVPEAEFSSYYGRPVLKPPVWKVPDVPGYFFLGGLAGASAVLGALADLTGRPGLARVARLGAAGGALSGEAALVHDLGRPSRFLNMLRVFKPTSPLSVGSWVLAPFSGLALAAAASDLTGRLRGPGRAAGFGAAALGPALTTYTAVLISDTAVPAWNAAHPEMPFVFAGSAMTTGGGLGLLAAPLDEVAPARRTAVLGAVMELAAAERVRRRLGLVGETYRHGRGAHLLEAGRVLTAAGVAGALLGRRKRRLTAVSGAAFLVAGLLTRFGIYEAGMASAREPGHTVVPQRERVSAHR